MNRCVYVLSLALAVVSAATMARSQSIALERETVTLPGGDPFDLEAGTVTVPENRDDPDSRTIRIGFVRATNPAANAGPPVFLLVGGPGGSSIEQVQQFMRRGGVRMLELFGGDLVGVDLRGVGRSGPDLRRSAAIARDPSVPGDPAIERVAMREASAAFAAELRAEGIDLEGYHTAAAADDVEAVRRALGYESITLWGTSYGSHLALAILRQHESAIHRVVLVGPEGPDHTIKTPGQVEAGLDALARVVAADEIWGGRIPDLRATVEKVLEPFREGPRSVEVDGETVGLSLWDVQTQIALSLGLVHRNMDALPARLEALAAGSYGELARAVRDARREHSTGPAVTMLFDSASGLSATRAERIADEAESALLGDVINFPFPDVREAWGARDLGDAFRMPVESDVPVLIVVGDLDARTPLANAHELLATLPHGVLFTVRNAGHDLNWLQGDLRKAWSAFLHGEPVTSRAFDAPAIRFAAPREG